MSCGYKKVAVDGHGNTWETSCGQKLYIKAPMEAVVPLAPLPNANGKFCR